MRSPTLPALLTLALLSPACGDDDADTASTTAAAEAPAEATAETPAEEEAPANPHGEEAGEAPAVSPHGHGMGSPKPPCEQALSDMRAMAASSPDAQENIEAQRESFLAGCRSLPEAMQRCMVMSYAVSHQEECREARENLDPAALERAQNLMGGGN